MIVDDQQFERDFFCHAVKKIDPTWQCLTASCSVEAINLLQAAEQLPHYIFLDVNMPGMDGIECLAAIKTNMAWVDIPVIICSGAISPKNLLLTEALGAAYYMVKQNNTEKLPNEIRFAIAKTDEQVTFLKIESDNKRMKNG